ncbi:polynucleotide adenylyltransferase [Malassezia yamatoensis]|uniref:polynucleotide adenylyltransferase n=1 Tax=Malassezia yamatoensis TaxID=253288 RepID=A0AAJ5YS27_9BASI|nr:polynucleotide adenylyltransferase [Malassezia yamatoensis]
MTAQDAKTSTSFGADDYIAFDLDDTETDEQKQPQGNHTSKVDHSIREHASARSTPWATQVEWHRCRNVAEMLDAEIRSYSQWISPTREEHVCRMMVIELLQRALMSEWPDAEVRSFGSQDTQLYLPQGLAEEIQVIGRAKVPIIKFVCPYGHFHVDISINQANGLQAARLVNRWLTKIPALRPLVMVIKQFLQQRALSEVFTGGLGSYSVTLLVLSFLQLHPKIQREEIAAEKNMGTLLLELLELYGKNYGYDDCGVTVRGLGGYFNKRKRGWYDGRKPFMLCIEDPHDVGNDIAKGSYAIISVRSALGGAFDILQAALCERANDLHAFRARQRALYDAQQQNQHTHFGDAGDSRLNIASQIKEPESLLGTILGVSRELTKRRIEIRELYESNALQERLDELSSVKPSIESRNAASNHIPTTPSANLPAEMSKAERKTARKAQKREDTLLRQHSDQGTGTESTRHAEKKAKVRPTEENESAVYAADDAMVRRSRQDSMSDDDTKYNAVPSSRKRQRDIYSASAEQNSDSDADLVAHDAPFVTESSDSEPLDGKTQQANQEAGQSGSFGIAIAGQAKRRRKSALSSKDRMAFWQAKSSESAPN